MEDESEADDEGFAAPSEELIASLQARYDNFAQGLPVQSEDELPAESPPAEETPARNKFRRRWSYLSNAHPLTSNLEPASSPGKSSWEVICIEDDEVRVPAEQAQASSVNSRPFQLMPSGSTRPRPSLRHLSKASPWSPPPVCIRYNSPFQLGCSGRVPRAPIPSTVACFSTPRPGVQTSPTQRGYFATPGRAKPLPAFKSAAAYAAYSKDASYSVIQESRLGHCPSCQLSLLGSGRRFPDPSRRQLCSPQC